MRRVVTFLLDVYYIHTDGTLMYRVTISLDNALSYSLVL